MQNWIWSASLLNLVNLPGQAQANPVQDSLFMTNHLAEGPRLPGVSRITVSLPCKS